MAPRRKKDDGGVSLPPPIPEPNHPAGQGPAWISQALGMPGCFTGAVRYLSDDGEESAIVLHFDNGVQQVFRPARLIITRRLTEVLGALGFPVPYYSPAQLATLGQAIGRIADHSKLEAEERSWLEVVSLVAGWVQEALRTNTAFVLQHRDGIHIRAAIEHVRMSHVQNNPTVAMIVEPRRERILIWTTPLASAIRERLGTMPWGDIGLQLRRAGLVRERLAARPGPGEHGTVEIPLWALPNGWQGINIEMPDEQRESGPCTLCLL